MMSLGSKIPHTSPAALTEQKQTALGLLQVPGSCPAELCLNLRAFGLAQHCHTSKGI